jgi:hypothetical protein
MNHFIHVISLATCKPNLYVFIDSEVNFAYSFYNNYKFSVAQKMLYRREILVLPPRFFWKGGGGNNVLNTNFGV